MSLLDKSIRYSYAYLFSTKRQPTDRIFDNRQVQIRDFYNQAIAKMVSIYDLRYPKNVVEPQIHIGKSVYSIDFEFHRQLTGQKLEKLISSYNLNFSGLKLSTAVMVSVLNLWLFSQVQKKKILMNTF